MHSGVSVVSRSHSLRDEHPTPQARLILAIHVEAPLQDKPNDPRAYQAPLSVKESQTTHPISNAHPHVGAVQATS